MLFCIGRSPCFVRCFCGRSSTGSCSGKLRTTPPIFKGEIDVFVVLKRIGLKRPPRFNLFQHPQGFSQVSHIVLPCSPHLCRKYAFIFSLLPLSILFLFLLRYILSLIMHIIDNFISRTGFLFSNERTYSVLLDKARGGGRGGWGGDFTSLMFPNRQM